VFKPQEAGILSGTNAIISKPHKLMRKPIKLFNNDNVTLYFAGKHEIKALLFITDVLNKNIETIYNNSTHNTEGISGINRNP
jgi:hypothetical protein